MTPFSTAMTSLVRVLTYLPSLPKPPSQNSLESEYKLASSHRQCLISMHLVCHYSAQAAIVLRCVTGRRHLDLRSGVRLYRVCIFVYRRRSCRPRGIPPARRRVPQVAGRTKANLRSEVVATGVSHDSCARKHLYCVRS